MLLYGIFRNVKGETDDDEKKVPDQQHVINIMVVGTPQKCGDKINGVIADDQDHQENREDDENCVVPCAISVEPSQVNVQMEKPAVLVVCAP